MNAPGWRLHPLHGDLEDHWSVDVSGNRRLTFKFEGEDAVLVDAIGTKGINQFAETGSKASIQPEHANRLRRLLSALDAATCPANMNALGYALHPLKGDLEGHWDVRVSGNWRLTFAFEGEDAILVAYQDYH